MNKFFVMSIIGLACQLSTYFGNAQGGSALNFDGLNDCVQIPHNALLKPSNNISIEAWIKPNNIHTNQFYEIYRKEDGNARHLLSFQEFGTVLSFGLQVNNIYSELDVPITATNYEGQWVHVAATFDGTSKKIYRNGLLIGLQNVSGAIGTSGTAPAYLGSSAGNNEFFNGSIDEFKLWSKALTPNEIQEGMTCELALPQTALVIYYNFNQGIAGANNSGSSVLLDRGANNYNAVLINFSLNGSFSNWVAPGGVTTGCSCSKPEILIGITSGSSSTCKDSTLSFSIIQSRNFTNLPVQWLINGVDVPGANASSFTSNNLNNNDTISCRVATTNCASPFVYSNQLIVEVADTQYRFVGNGLWTTRNNWLNNSVPPSVLLPCSQILIDPINGGECVLDTLVYLVWGSKLRVVNNKRLRVLNSIESYKTDSLSTLQDSLISLADSRIFPLSDTSALLRVSSVNESENQLYSLQTNIFKAARLLTDTNRVQLSFNNEGVNMPAQKGLAYVSAGDNYKAKWQTERFKNGNCIEKLHGLECNGFVSRILMDAGIIFTGDVRLTTSEFKDTTKINTFLKKTSVYNKLRYLPGKFQLIRDSIKTGDIIYWSGHVGICYRNYAHRDSLYVFQSNGSPSDCITNKAQNKRGPRAVRFTEIVRWTAAFGEYYISKLDKGNCAPSILNGYTLLGDFNGHRYFISNTGATWNQANSLANGTGGHLVTITSADENNFISSKTSVSAWIGLTDEGSEGNFRWVTGETLQFTSWLSGEPNNGGGNENWVHTNWGGLGKWNDAIGSYQTFYIVEFDCY